MKCFLAKRPHLDIADDLRSEAYLAVVEAIGKALQCNVVNIDAYLSTCVKQALNFYFDKQRDKRTRGGVETICDHCCHRFNVPVREIGKTVECEGCHFSFRAAESRKLTVSLGLIDEPASLDQKQEVLKDILKSCKDDTDRTIVELRLTGYTDGEISRRLGIPRRTVHSRRRELAKRYEGLS